MIKLDLPKEELRQLQRDAAAAACLAVALLIVLIWDYVAPRTIRRNATVAQLEQIEQQLRQLGAAAGDIQKLADGGEIEELDADQLEKLQEQLRQLSAGGEGLEGIEGIAGLEELLKPATPREPEPVAVPELNRRVLQFAVDHVGQQVGNGECWTLANQALIDARAKPAVEYTFGTRVTMDEILPGDVLQFHDVRLEGPGYWAQYGAPHHTAIVESRTGDSIQLLHQNLNGDRTVQRTTMNLTHQTQGTIQAYRPQPR